MLTSRLASSSLNNTPFLSPEETYQLSKRLWQQITVQSLAEKWQQLRKNQDAFWEQMVNNEVAAKKALSPAAILALEKEYANKKLAAYVFPGRNLSLTVDADPQALWDIKGKVLNAPVWQLMGGLVRDKIKAYSWVGGDRPADVIDGIKTLREIDFDTFKLNGCEELGLIDNSRAVDAAVNTVAQIREAFGNQIEFGLDFHGRVSAPMAKVLIKELEPYRPLFIEEPVLAEQAEYYPKLAAQTHIPLAAGERMFSRFDFKRVLEAGGISILQPDLSHAGGITECYKIAGMAEAYDVTLAPHCPLGPIALAACLHIDFVSYNAVLQEQSMGIHYNKGAELLDFVKNKEDFSMVGGFFKPLTKPGLGVEIDEAKVIEFSKNAPDWRNPLWRHEDNSVAEW